MCPPPRCWDPRGSVSLASLLIASPHKWTKTGRRGVAPPQVSVSPEGGVGSGLAQSISRIAMRGRGRNPAREGKRKPPESRSASRRAPAEEQRRELQADGPDPFLQGRISRHTN